MDIHLYYQLQVLTFTHQYDEALLLIDQIRSKLDQSKPNSQDIENSLIMFLVEIHSNSGNFLKLKNDIQEFLKARGLVEGSESFVEPALAKIDPSQVAFYDKILDHLLNSALIVGNQELIKKFRQSPVALHSKFKTLANGASVSVANQTTKVEVNNEKLISSLEFIETPDLVNVNIKSSNLEFKNIEIDANDDSNLKIETNDKKMDMTLKLLDHVKGLQILKNESWGVSFTLTKTNRGIWEKLLKESLANIVVVNNSIYEKPKNPYLSNKNWDKIVEQEEIESIKQKDYGGTDPTMHFFKEIYKNADADTQRAMMKSYLESDGKALSTNWKEVAEKNYKEEFKNK